MTASASRKELQRDFSEYRIDAWSDLPFRIGNVVIPRTKALYRLWFHRISCPMPVVLGEGLDFQLILWWFCSPKSSLQHRITESREPSSHQAFSLCPMRLGNWIILNLVCACLCDFTPERCFDCLTCRQLWTMDQVSYGHLCAESRQAPLLDMKK